MANSRDIDWLTRLAEAQTVVQTHLDRTPLVRVELGGFDPRTYLKLESLQPTGSFKVRGALAAVATAARDGRPVVTASAGNHGLGVAFAATRLNARATVVVPENASSAKVEALRRFDIDLRLVGDATTRRSRPRSAWRSRRTPSSSPRTPPGRHRRTGHRGRRSRRAGRRTVPHRRAGRWRRTRSRDRARCSRTGQRHRRRGAGSRAVSASMSAGRVIDVDVEPTIADGLAGNIAADTITPGILRQHGVRVTAADEAAIRAAVRELALRHGIVAEGSAAVGIAAAAAGNIPADLPTVFVITGRNIAADRLAGILAE